MTFQYFGNRTKQVKSQCDQDGVITTIFDLIGNKDHIFIEVGGGSNSDNTAYIGSLKMWKGYLFNSGLYYSGGQRTDTPINSEWVNQFNVL